MDRGGDLAERDNLLATVERMRLELLSLQEDQKEAELALRESEASFRALIEGAPDAVFVHTDRCFTFLNPAAMRLFGAHSPEELIGRPVIDRVHPSLRDVIRERIHSLYVEKKCLPMLEAIYLRLDGSEVPVDASAVPITYKGKDGGLVFARDASERKKAEEERNRLKEQLRQSQKMEAIGRLAGGVAHDFNNLLSVIMGYTELALERVHDGDATREDLLEVRRAAENATTLIGQLLAFSRKQILQPFPLDLNRTVAGMNKMLRRIIGEDIDLVQWPAPDLGVVMADPGQVEQVIMNLVVNARDAMPEGGKIIIETANVELDDAYAASHVGVTPGPYVRLAVTDTGCGLDEQTRASIFDPFFTTKPKGRGTGLGLATAYGIVKQSGGNIWVYSEPGKGTTFKIYLPRELRAVAEVSMGKAVSRPTVGTETILVVEDEDGVRKLAERVLSAAGYTVLTAANGAEGLLACERHAGEIHLVLTDVIMPEMSGPVFVERLAKARPGIRILYMSGYTENAITHHGVLDPGTSFIGKPFSSSELRRKVREVLDEGTRDRLDGIEEEARDPIETKDRALTEDALRSLPPGVTNELRKAVVTARYDEMVAVVENIRLTAPDVADALLRMVEDFDYDGILDLIGH